MGNQENQFEITRIELIGGHTPRHGLSEEDVRPIPKQEDIENALGDILDIVEGLTCYFIPPLHTFQYMEYKIFPFTPSEKSRSL